MRSSRASMSTSELSNLASQTSAPVPSGGNSTGWWLGSQSVFEQKDERRLGRAMTVSMGLHAGLAALLLIAGIRQVVIAEKEAPVKFDVVFLKEPGPGGGGGGSPAPAPPKKLEIPKPKAPETLPTPEPVVAPPPIPTLNAPVTTASQLLQAQ